MAIKQLYPTIRPSLNLNFARAKRLDPRIQFTRASIGTYVDSSGIIRTADPNEPRFDHDPATGESLGLLVEEQRTNVFFNGNTFTGQSCTSSTVGDARFWGFSATGSGTCTPNATVAPDGSQTATLMTLTDNDFSYLFSNAAGSPTSFGSGPRCLSVFVKSHPDNTVHTFILYQGGGADYGCTFNVAPGAPAQTFTDGYSVKYPNGWFRLVLNKAGVTSGGTMILNWPEPKDIQKFYIWGAQGEAAPFPTSHIPTQTNAETTRSADVGSISGPEFAQWYNDQQGSLYSEFYKDSSYNPSVGNADKTSPFFIEGLGLGTSFEGQYGGITGRGIPYPGIGVYGRNLLVKSTHSFSRSLGLTSGRINMSNVGTAQGDNIAESLTASNNVARINFLNKPFGIISTSFRIKRIAFYPAYYTLPALQTLTR